MKHLVIALILFILAATANAAPAPSDCAAAAETLKVLREAQLVAEAYHVDYQKYPPAASIQELQPLVQPAYIRTMSLRDGWGNPIFYLTFAGGTQYVIASPGADGKFDEATWTREPKSYSDDAVIRSGAAPRLWATATNCQ